MRTWQRVACAVPTLCGSQHARVPVCFSGACCVYIFTLLLHIALRLLAVACSAWPDEASIAPSALDLCSADRSRSGVIDPSQVRLEVPVRLVSPSKQANKQVAFLNGEHALARSAACFTMA